MISFRHILENKAIVMLAGTVAEARSARGDSPGWIRIRTGEERTAFHEAGHAVVARGFGLHVYSASIKPDPEQRIGNGYSAGRVQFGASPTKPAGKFGVGLHDHQEVARLCWALTGGRGWRPALHTVRLLRVRTAELVDANWPAVIAISSELMQRRELDQTELADVLQSFAIAA